MFIESKSEIFPSRVEIELTNDCNSRCTYCPRRFMKYDIGFMDKRLFHKIIDESSNFKVKTLVLFRRGESLLHPDFIEMLTYCKGKFQDIQLATNASMLNETISKILKDCINFISFSIELPARYKKYRLLDYSGALKNINYFLLINKKVKTQVSIVNTSDIAKKDLEKFKNQWLGKVDRVRIYEEHSRNGKFGSLINPPKQRKPCVKPFNDILIFWDGQVGRCNHDWGDQPLGSVLNKTIGEVWQSSGYKALRKQHLDLNITDKVCSNCDSWYEDLGECKIGKVYEKYK